MYDLSFTVSVEDDDTNFHSLQSNCAKSFSSKTFNHCIFTRVWIPSEKAGMNDFGGGGRE